MSVPPHSGRKGTNSRHHNQPLSPPPTSHSFPASVTREAQPPRGDNRGPVGEPYSNAERAVHASYTSGPSPHGPTTQATRATNDRPHKVSHTSTRSEGTDSLSSVKSAKSTITRDSGYAEAEHSSRGSRHTATSAPSVYSQDSQLPRRDGLHRSHSDSTKHSVSSHHVGPSAPVMAKDGRTSQRASSQGALTDAPSLRTSTNQASVNAGAKPRPSHRRSSSDTSDLRRAPIYGPPDPSFEHRRSSDSKATRPVIYDTGQDRYATRGSWQSSTSSYSSAHSTSFWADNPASRDPPSTANTSLFRLNTDVPKRKPSQGQVEQSTVRQSKPLPDIPESPVSPPHPVSAGVEVRPRLPEHQTSRASDSWILVEAPRGAQDSLRHHAIGNAQLASNHVRGLSSDLIDITEITSALEDVCKVFQRRDILSAKEAIKKFLRTVEDSKASLLARLPEYVRHVHNITLAAAAVDSRKTVFDDYCLEINTGASGSELAQIFDFSTMLLRDLCASFALLLGECSKALYRYRADPKECARIDSLQDAHHAMDAVARVVHANLDSALQTAREMAKAGESGRSLVNAITGALLKPFKRTAVPPQANSAQSGQTSVPVTRRPRSHSEPRPGPFDASKDNVIQDLNIELQSAKAVFDSISQNYLSTPNDAPIPLNPKYVRYGNPHDGKKPQMVAITVEELVRYFARNTDSTESDTIALMDAFFLFFRHYVTAEQLVATMVKVFSEPMPRDLERAERTAERRRWRAAQTSTKLGVVRLLAFWLEQYFLAVTDEGALAAINHFTFEVVARDADLPRRAAWLVSMHLCNAKGGRRDQKYPRFPSSFERLLKDGERGRMEYAPTGFVHDAVDSLRPSEIAKLDVKFFGNQKGGAHELARALTMLESEIIHGSMPIAFFHHREEKPAKTIAAMRDWSNALGLWVRECIQTLPTARERATTFNTFTTVMQHCLELRNYSSAMTILLALKAVQSSQRFALTLTIVSSRSKEIVQEIDNYFGDSRQNYPLYRKDMATTAAPANPLFFLVGGDLAKVAAMKKQVEAEYGLEGLSKHKAWVFPQYLVRLQGIVRDLERCYALYGLPVNERIKQWLMSEVKRMEGCKYDDVVRSLGSIHHADEKASFITRKPNVKSTTTL